jgi:hypothetical protein
MPESVTDRPTKSHEQIFLLTKSPRYFFDQEAVREASKDPEDDLRRVRGDLNGYNRKHTEGGTSAFKTRDLDAVAARIASGRNIRSVWEIATEPYPEAHFATFPQALVEPCIKAGTSERGCCPECGAPWVREVGRPERPGVERGSARLVPSENGRSSRKVGQAYQDWLDKNPPLTTGWKPSCAHDCVNGHNFRTQNPCVVLDPFLGSGTTALVARRLGRKCIGVELSPEYAALAAKRLSQLSLLA